MASLETPACSRAQARGPAPKVGRARVDVPTSRAPSDDGSSRRPDGTSSMQGRFRWLVADSSNVPSFDRGPPAVEPLTINYQIGFTKCHAPGNESREPQAIRRSDAPRMALRRERSFPERVTSRSRCNVRSAHQRANPGLTRLPTRRLPFAGLLRPLRSGRPQLQLRRSDGRERVCLSCARPPRDRGKLETGRRLDAGCRCPRPRQSLRTRSRTRTIAT